MTYPKILDAWCKTLENIHKMSDNTDSKTFTLDHIRVALMSLKRWFRSGVSDPGNPVSVLTTHTLALAEHVKLHGMRITAIEDWMHPPKAETAPMSRAEVCRLVNEFSTLKSSAQRPSMAVPLNNSLRFAAKILADAACDHESPGKTQLALVSDWLDQIAKENTSGVVR